MPRRAVAATVALLALVSACSDGDDDATARTTTSAVPTDEHDDEGSAGLTEIASQLLVTTAEVGLPGLVDRGYTPGSCDDALDEEHPPDVRVGLASSDDATGLALGQEIRVYPSIEESAAAYDSGVFGLCERVPTGSAVDVTGEVGADAANRVDIVGPDEETTIITAVVGDAVVSFVFTGPPGAATAAAFDPLDVAAFGIGKILGALESG